MHVTVERESVVGVLLPRVDCVVQAPAMSLAHTGAILEKCMESSSPSHPNSEKIRQFKKISNMDGPLSLVINNKINVAAKFIIKH